MSPQPENKKSKAAGFQSALPRRSFLAGLGGGCVAGAFHVGLSTSGWSQGFLGDRLRVGFVGIGGRGASNFKGVSDVKEVVDVTAICDVDRRTLEGGLKSFPNARTYTDVRKMLDAGGLDAVVVSTPDHTHAYAAVASLRAGHHVYCEKPLARTVSEARAITDEARRQNRVTQIGTQIHSGDNYRRVVEWVRSGRLGKIEDVHVWVNSSYGGMDWPSQVEEPPAYLDYDSWLGPVEPVPFSTEWVPFKWRHWWRFGGGSLADFGCHYMDLPHWALGLRHPEKVELLDGPEPHPDSTPQWLIVRFTHPEAAGRPPVRVTWYHGGKRPDFLTPEQVKAYGSGVWFQGSKGSLIANYGRHELVQTQGMKKTEAPPQVIAPTIGHHREWVMAILGRARTTCPFDYSGPLSETALLGNVAFRAGSGFTWDAANLKAVDLPRADEFIQHRYRKGWSL